MLTATAVARQLGLSPYAHLTHDTLAEAVGKIGRKLPHKPPPKAKKKATAKVA